MELELNYSSILLTLGALHLVAAMSPGPSVILVAHAAAFKSRNAGLVAATAMGVGAAVWASAALFGFDVFFTKNSDIFHFLQIIGSAFLTWTGIKMFLSARKPIDDSLSSTSNDIFLPALKLQLSNPKVVIFFSSIFLAALPLGSPLWFKILILGVIFINETLWYALLAYLLSTSGAQIKFAQMRSLIAAVCGTLLSILGIKLFLGIF